MRLCKTSQYKSLGKLPHLHICGICLFTTIGLVALSAFAHGDGGSVAERICHVANRMYDVANSEYDVANAKYDVAKPTLAVAISQRVRVNPTSHNH